MIKTRRTGKKRKSRLPPGGVVVLSLDEKTQIQALNRTQPVLPIAFDASEKRTYDRR
ncbi:hypothetical protein AB0L13_46775 [Saccharopolyspora shandongensis]